jgi:hypothetical protein
LPLASVTTSDAVARTIEQAIESANSHGLDAVSPWSHAMREMMGAVAVALREFGIAPQQAEMAIVKHSTVAAESLQIIKTPDQCEQHQKILALIKDF